MKILLNVNTFIILTNYCNVYILSMRKKRLATKITIMKNGYYNFFIEQLEQSVNKPTGTEYIIRFISCLPKGLFKRR